MRVCMLTSREWQHCHLSRMSKQVNRHIVAALIVLAAGVFGIAAGVLMYIAVIYAEQHIK